jgi:hypothetical protein
VLGPGPVLLATLLLRVAAPADSQWMVAPPSPTVGDTIWLFRIVSHAPDWRLRPAPFDNQGDVVSLGDPEVEVGTTADTVRYAVVSWTAGAHRFRLPTLWLVGSGGRSDSLAGADASVTVRSVIPADSTRPAPKGLLPPLDPGPDSLWPPIIATVLGLLALFGAVRLRRRGPRAMLPPAQFVTGGGAPDDRWLAAGEPKAVAARATRVLRQALHRVVPEAVEALPVREALEAAEGRLPGTTFRRIRESLLALDQVSYAVAHGADVARVAADARALAQEL